MLTTTVRILVVTWRVLIRAHVVASFANRLDIRWIVHYKFIGFFLMVRESQSINDTIRREFWIRRRSVVNLKGFRKDGSWSPF